MSSAIRNGLLAKIHVAKKQLGLSDADYRAVLAGQGVESAKDLDRRGLERLVSRLADLGFQETGRKIGKKDRPPVWRQARETPMLEKVQAMLAEKGARDGTDVPWSYAAAILKRMYGPKAPERLEWATAEQLRSLIAALHRDEQRHEQKRAEASIAAMRLAERAEAGR